jgi:hypothetical protein
MPDVCTGFTGAGTAAEGVEGMDPAGAEGLDLPIDEAALDALAEVLAADPSARLAVLNTFEAALKTVPKIAFLSKLKSPIKNSSYSVIILTL